MTGFGRAEATLPRRPGSAGRAVVEVRTVNHRFLEVEARLPEGLQAFEENLRQAVGRWIQRGQVRVSVVVRPTEESLPVAFDEPLARSYAGRLQRLQHKLKVKGEITLPMLLSLPRVVTVQEREGAGVGQWPRVETAVQRALQQAVQMRRKEGRRLQKVLRQLARRLQDLTDKIRRKGKQIQADLEQRLAARIRVLCRSLPGGQPDPKTLTTEAAALIQSADVREELDRMDSHLAALNAALKGHPSPRKGTSPGRTIDFLAQELHREVNTLGAKLRDRSLVSWVVEMKGQVEKIREQAANLE